INLKLSNDERGWWRGRGREAVSLAATTITPYLPLVSLRTHNFPDTSPAQGRAFGRDNEKTQIWGYLKCRRGSPRSSDELVENVVGPYWGDVTNLTCASSSSVAGPPRRLAPHEQPSKGFLHDLTTMRWMVRPSSSFKILIAPIVLYLSWQLVGFTHNNPWERLLFVSNRLPDAPDGTPLYAKSYWSITEYLLKPFARLHKARKLDRFAEQGYAVIYSSVSGPFGLVGTTMMSETPTHIYQWTMYKLSSLGNGRMEKPRSDFAELVAHHFVTLWLIGWSYLINLTLIGNAVYMTMDFSDIFLSLALCLNYLKMEKTKAVAFAWFAGVWTAIFSSKLDDERSDNEDELAEPKKKKAE
ncbi:5900_t:CDS:2, partial [Acaulospora colombiana]